MPITHCRICEAMCGLVVDVEDGRVTQVRPDPDNPMSRGYACPKGIAMTELQNSPERVLHPLRRRPDGSFARVGWDEALDDIARRLGRLPRRQIGLYTGVPATTCFGMYAWTRGFAAALGTPHHYGAQSQDISSRYAASALLYGSPTTIPIPDIERTDFLFCLGANPFVSNGSVMTAANVRERLKRITKRGGRVVVADPRRTETARTFEHLPVRPDTDAWLLLSMLHVIFAESLEDRAYLARHARHVDALREHAARFPPEATEARTGARADRVRALARDLAAAPSAIAYGRTGACRGRFGTLVTALLDALNVVTGNLDRPGGMVFPASALPLGRVARLTGGDSYGKHRTRIGGFPDTTLELPTGILAKAITEPGHDRVRALIVTAGNPVGTVPNPDELEGALRDLELLVSIDLFVTDTNRHADYILPATTWLERSETYMVHSQTSVQPFIQFSEAAVAPYGEAREEWEVFEELGRRMGIVPQMSAPARLAARVVRLTPLRQLDLMLRTGPYGDLLGLRRGGLSLRTLRERHPHGVRFREHHPTGTLRRRVRLCPPPLQAELRRLRADPPTTTPEFPLLLVSLRELRSHNSWTQRSEKLMRNRRFAVRVHPDDARAAGVEDGATARLASKTGAVEVPVAVTDEMMPGTVSLPFGWGPANHNALISSEVEDIEPLAGMTWLNGVPVDLTSVGRSG